jgi:hypothetical protein
MHESEWARERTPVVAELHETSLGIDVATEEIDEVPRHVV